MPHPILLTSKHESKAHLSNSQMEYAEKVIKSKDIKTVELADWSTHWITSLSGQATHKLFKKSLYTAISQRKRLWSPVEIYMKLLEPPVLKPKDLAKCTTKHINGEERQIRQYAWFFIF